MRGEKIGEPLIGAVAALVSGLALAGSTTWPPTAVIAAAVMFGAVFWAVVWAVTQGAVTAFGARMAVAVAAGLLLGELAAVAVFSGQIDEVLTARDSPAAATATAALDQARAERTGLDDAVAQANRNRDEALIVARCEVNPSAACPQIRITGVPGSGPEARTADAFLDDAQRRLDAAVADRDGRAPVLDDEVRIREQALAQARQDTLTGGLGVRWQAMNTYVLDHPGSLILRLLVVAFFVLLTVLPLWLKRWRGTSAVEADTAADTAIAVNRAQVRAQVDQMWAEQELNSARMAIAAQNEIDAERQRRRVAQACGVEPEVPEVPEVVVAERVDHAELPAPVQRSAELEPQRGMPVIGEVTNAAARLIMPFVPPIVAGAVDNVSRNVARTVGKPLRQVFTETEEFHFTLRRTHRVTVESDADPEDAEQPRQVTSDREWVDANGPHIESRRTLILGESDGPAELTSDAGPRQLPPG
ncbi:MULTISPECIES: DUF4407 domain-containing protein [Mycobacteriaceae]|uniref:Membrane protein n=1 Tax=Mycolicibacterium neoaurum VKM Ac-1815D TaxID=700508 RepID=V5X9U8_MYCNE|nr:MULTISPECIES: DUF4407 domain-containing protein [Mycobacteriaceae]AXK76890.1 DUF4407 domain-containing protein [Mycolicibacterium neoaurum]KUM10309.1 hypothetical protein AVZ31_01130 [Mycolicibacterium neoaurum]